MTLLPKRMRRQPADAGVLAVVVAVVVVLALIPVVALALTSYTRSGVTAEMQRAADSGALAGAASLGLLDVGTTLNDSVLADGILDDVLAIPDSFAVLGSSGRACAAARAAYGQATADDPTRTPEAVSPLSEEFTAGPGCDARYSPEPAFSECVDQAYVIVDGVTGNLTERVTELLETGLLGDLLGDAADVLETADAVKRLVPAVAHNGVRVDLRYAVDGPLDDVFTRGQPPATTTSATARRLFKPLLPDLGPAFAEDVADVLYAPELAGVLGEALDTLSPVEQLAVQQLQLVIQVLRVLVGEVQAQEQLQDLLDGILEPLTSELDPLLPVLEPLLGPVTLPSSLRPLTGPCLTAVQDLLDDLSYALSIDRDSDDRELLPCLVQQVIGLEILDAVVATTQSCANRVFRAQLAPNAQPAPNA